uniref:DUF1080 domain-containing protein n=1 Tax=Roseihalotalea indica TaxID=2867963 RepID=A0AA49JKG0_9BACT|nr:DUF1080 domain-containing protein [Tunicatimonas sp. TK19036]
MTQLSWSLLFGIILSPLLLQAQTSQSIPFTADRWEFSGEHTLEDYKGQSCVLLNNSQAYLTDVDFENGIIEYDIAFTEDRGFTGVMFRMQDKKNYEEYYMRAHQSGNPDAMQYTPVFNGVAGWQLYYGEGYGVPHHYRFQEWMHVKLVVSGSQMEVYIDNMSVPVLHAFELKREPAAGFLGLYTFVKEARFANFSYQTMDNPPIKSADQQRPSASAETITQWQVSSAFSQKLLDGQTTFPEALAKNLAWQPLESESTGTVNLAQISEVSDTTNTVIAKFTIEADRAQVKPLHFGYSDIATVYVNGTAVYEGQRIFNSRDYRYLGTIGYFDTLFLSLKKGKNEVWFAVTENFGGWGICARVSDFQGIAIAP